MNMSMDFSTLDLNDDAAVMQAVLDLAKKGQNTTQPNPMVGCILVRDNEIVGSGFHAYAGQLHAERLAIAEAGERARGATAFVNLEPCCHQGKTPPCTDGLIDAGVRRVVYAMRDPNPLVEGGGHELLTSAGIEVGSGILEPQARWLNRGFISRMMRQRPWVILKTAATLDGRTAAFDGESKWITGESARTEVQALRASVSAVITGIGTVLADDPRLNVRVGESQRQPYRVLLDSQLQLPLDAKIIGDDDRLLVFTCVDDLDKTAALIELGVEVIKLPANDQGRLDLNSVLNELARWQCNEVLLEAGQTLAGAFLHYNLVDELALFYAASVLGEQGRGMFELGAPLAFKQRPEFKLKQVRQVGDDVLMQVVNPASITDIGSESAP